MLAALASTRQLVLDTVSVCFRVVVVGECPSGEAVEPGIAVCVVPVAVGEAPAAAWVGEVKPVVGLVAEERRSPREVATNARPLATSARASRRSETLTATGVPSRSRSSR